jgi:RHS repeat-associated protein
VATIDPASGSVNGTFAYTEFGASESGGTTKYGWKGADQRDSNALGQQILMGVRAYNPETGRFSQVDSVVGGSANSYDYSNQNPVTGYDLTGTRGNSNASWCRVSGHWKTCQAYVSEWRTHVLIGLLYGGAGASAALSIVCGWFCASIGAGLGLLAPTIQTIDDWGGDRGIFFEVWYYRVSWYWWGWHHKWVYTGGYTWHQ